MTSENFHPYMGYLWIQQEGNVYTIGINEEGLEEISEISNVDLPREGEEIEADLVCGSVETDDGPLDIYSPVSGTVIEINSSVVEEPSLIQEDPFEGWLIKLESEEKWGKITDDDGDDEDDVDKKNHKRKEKIKEEE